MADIHTVAECSKKLVVLLDKIKQMDHMVMSKYHLDDVKALARELENESEFISGIR